MAVKLIALIACLFVFFASCYAQGSCTASASLTRRESLGNGIYTYDVTVTNTGNCALNDIELEFAYPTTGQIIRAWNLAQRTETVFALQNFGLELSSRSTFTGAGFIFQCGGKTALTVSIFTQNCTQTGCNDPPAIPTETPTSAPTAPPTLAPNPNIELIRRLKTAPSQLERQAMLTDSDFVFDFTSALTGVSAGNGGKTVSATSSNFPALIGHDIAMTVGFLSACSMNLPHTHPRATEINFIAKGSFQAGFFMENGARFIGNRMEVGMVTVFPRGSIHFEINLSCDDAIFVAAFNNEDPGVQTTAPSFFGLPRDIVQSSVNVSRIKTVEDFAAYLPANPSVSLDECRARCNLN